MFLTARVFGILTYTIVMALALWGVRYLPLRQTKYVLWGYLFALCTISFLYLPYISTDIARLQPYADNIAKMPLNDFFYLLTNAKSGLFTLIYFRLFHACLMPVTCFIVIGTMFYMLYQSSKLLQVTRSIIMLGLLWLMTNDFFLTAITNIRSYVVVSFVAFCIYRETFQHKFSPLNILLYLCAIEMHAMGIVLVAFRVLVYLFSSGKFTIWKMVLIPLLLAGLVLGFPLYHEFLLGSADKFESYYTSNPYNYIWERVLFIIQTILQLYILAKAYLWQLFKNPLFTPYKTAVTLGVIVLVICHLHVTFMQRWIVFSTLLELPVLIRLLQIEQQNHKHQIRQVLITFCFVTFALVCTRGNLCALKFWE